MSLERAEWEASLPSVVARFADRWDLELGDPVVDGGKCSWVALCTRGAEELVLKVGWPHPESRDEAKGLREWNGDGTVLVRESDGDVLLLERLGSSLESRPQDEQDVVIAGLLRRLWRPPAGGFRPLSQMCDQWADNAVPDVDPFLARLGTELFRSLSREGPEVLLATDLHAGNILAGTREPWLVIDPKPYVGDPCYDVLQHLLNCSNRLMADPHVLVRRMAELCELDAERVRLWLFARLVVESAELPFAAELARRLAP